MMDAQMIFFNFSGCQDLRGGVKTQVLHSRNQLNPARVSCPTTQTKQVSFHFDNYCLKPGAHWKPFETLITCKMCYRLHTFKSTCCSDLGCSLIKGTLWSVFERKELFLNSVFLTETKLILNPALFTSMFAGLQTFSFLTFLAHY